MSRFFATVLILLWAPAISLAGPMGDISGSVSDQGGAPLVSVPVEIRGTVDRATQTNRAGEFSFQDLPEGEYEVSAELSGFGRAHRTVKVANGERVTVPFVLRIAVAEETVVTAAKGGERDVQTLPMAISAITGSELARLGTRRLDEAVALAPSVTFSQNTGFGQLTIRGIGANVVFAGGDPSSAMYLDGVYLGRPAMELMQFLDLERIEVMRGPQGTLYGRNAVGGAINMVSRPPTNEFEASADVTAGNFEGRRVGARIAGPIRRDSVMGSVSFARAVRDGYVRDLEHPDHPLGGEDITAARGHLRVVLNGRTDLLLSSDIDIQEGTPLTFNKVLAEKPGFDSDNPPALHDVRTSVRAWNHTRNSGGSARLTMALTPVTTLTSLTAFRKLDFEYFVEADMTEIDLLTTDQDERQQQFSEEITLSHEKPGLTWLAGVFLFDEDDRQEIRVDQAQQQTQVRLTPQVDATSTAFFGQATFDLMSSLSATAGVRYTHERKEIDNAGGRYRFDPPETPVPGSVYGYSDAITHDAWTPKIGMEMKLRNGSLAYVSATRGFKSGGFNPSSTTPGRGFAPEWVWSYEAGWKGDLMGGRSQFDATAFHMDYTDLQVQTPIGIGVFDIRNAAAATIRGVEAAGTFRLLPGLQTGGHVTWLDAVYDEYIAVDNGGVIRDVSGNRLNNAPEWAGRLWFEWSGDLGRSRRLSIAADATAQSTVFYTPFNDNIQRQEPYALLGGRIEYGSSDRRWAVAAYARNITDTDYIVATFGTSPAAFGGRPGPSRQFAVELSVRR